MSSIYSQGKSTITHNLNSQEIESWKPSKGMEQNISLKTGKTFVCDDKILKFTKSYPASSQVEYLHLQTEIDLLLQELQTLKQKKLIDDKFE